MTTIRKDSHKRKILIVEDDANLRLLLQHTLTEKGYMVDTCERAEVARSYLNCRDFDLLITDIHLQNSDSSGLGLLQYVRSDGPRIPVIMMTGIDVLSEVSQAYELGVDVFLAKPFKLETFLNAIRFCLDGETSAEGLVEDTNFCKLHIDLFQAGREIPYNIFIRLSDSKFLKVAHRGEDLTLGQIKSYREKGIRNLYIRREDFRRLISFPAGSSKCTPAEKIRNLEQTNNDILKNLYLSDLTPEAFEGAMAIVEGSINVLTEFDDVFGLIEILNQGSETVYAHGLGVSLYSVLIARELGWQSPSTLYKIAIGGLLHDVGEKELPPHLWQRHEENLSPDEIRQVRAHPVRSLEILRSIPTIPTDVLQIVLEHHEDCRGEGYPSRHRRNEIHPLARLVAVSDEFCQRVLNGSMKTGVPAKVALSEMIKTLGSRLDPMYLSALMKVFQMEIPSDFSRIFRNVRAA